jgi:AMP-binding enzyme
MLMADDYASAVMGLLAAACAHCPVLRVNRQVPALYQAAITADARPWAILEEEPGGSDLQLTVVGGGEGTQTQIPDAAYVICTSGSTGRPKGVVVSHQALLDRLRGLVRLPGLAGGESMLAMAALSFDMSVTELFLPLAVGGCVIAAPAPAVRGPVEPVRADRDDGLGVGRAGRGIADDQPRLAAARNAARAHRPSRPPDRGDRTARGDRHLRPGTSHVVPGPAGADQGAVHRSRYP